LQRFEEANVRNWVCCGHCMETAWALTCFAWPTAYKYAVLRGD